MIQMIIIDDDDLVKSSLKMILEATKEVNVMALGSNGLEALDLYKQYHPDIVLSDIRMPVCDGIEASKLILEYDNTAKIVLLTTFEDETYITKALAIGVRGYILKQSFDMILPTLKSIMNEASVFSNKVISKLKNNAPSQVTTTDYDSLTNLERIIIHQIALGYNNKEIALNLSFSEGSIRNSISTILSKLSLRDRTQIAIFYFQDMKTSS